ncbi:hypothetical protein MNEG_1190 [Monoraphidium neglectum]|jgi:hypothetical protein|uniref:Golgi to ER traffic protein 4 n=1 Tax=Monoraphidium neglectum TaxID=145388 RepID=A0A0D2N303_9CHLO|nr:hypothetical protein MNEG_1190 [Monoraphidium neglectum]KIZ06762.1 hypothetical protein MNEG_1190 [Monoraphidium neglectum]|eukprot:XP_013905781.1 hypothetical protein MNEG_1190 [Monoraphidium neglectum]
MASASGTATSAGVQKALQRVKAQLDAGAFYEAQQMYKTTYHRYHTRKQLDEAYTVLSEGAVQQLRGGQITCGTELGTMLVDAYVADKAPAGPVALGALCDIVRAMPAHSAEDAAGVDACSRFVTAAVKWAHKQGADAGVRELHDLFAQHLIAAYGWRQLGRASVHFARGADAGAFAAALAGCAAEAPAEELDLFAARAVLQTLACAHSSTTGRQLQHADAVLDACKRRPWAGGAPLPDSPLLHFCQFLLTALQQRSTRLEKLLKAKYGPSLARDPTLGAYLARIEELYLDAGGGGGGGGLLAGLLRGLLEGDEED